MLSYTCETRSRLLRLEFAFAYIQLLLRGYVSIIQNAAWPLTNSTQIRNSHTLYSTQARPQMFLVGPRFALHGQ